jgi:hypothetical protein
MSRGTTSSAGRRLGHEAARVAVRETLSRISESGESTISATPVPTPVPSQTMSSKAKDACHMVTRSRLAMAVLVFLFTFVLLCALNPPMAQSREAGDESRSWKKIAAWSSVTALLAVLLPLIKRT